MAVKLRLKRMGAKQKPFYRIIVADSRSPRDGRFIETVGTYNPLKETDKYTFKEEEIISWLNKGAQPTDTVKSILSSNGIWAKFKATKAPKAAKKAEKPAAEKKAPAKKTTAKKTTKKEEK